MSIRIEFIAFLLESSFCITDEKILFILKFTFFIMFGINMYVVKYTVKTLLVVADNQYVFSVRPALEKL